MKKILVLPGSLRKNSSSNLIIKAILSLAPPEASLEVFDDLGSLPHFNDPEEVPSIVATFKKKISEADAVLICTPEYAFGIPGSLKNAIDWTVGSGELVEKPVGLITASSQGERGHAAMLLVLTAVSAKVAEASTLLISFVRTKIDAQGNVKDEVLLARLRDVVVALSTS
jgi:chromate reductase